jgi:pimeloyl-ACP methyl ester carboxylesterase
MIGGALKDGPDGLAVDGGHWIFKYVPMFLLHKMQPSLSESFFEAAVHRTNREHLRTKAVDLSNRNDMRFCKAFYRQQVYAGSNEASQLGMKTLVIHGHDDQVLPLTAGEHLSESLQFAEMIAIPESSHQVFQEKPMEVAEVILKFVSKTRK